MAAGQEDLRGYDRVSNGVAEFPGLLSKSSHLHGPGRWKAGFALHFSLPLQPQVDDAGYSSKKTESFLPSADI